MMGEALSEVNRPPPANGGCCKSATGAASYRDNSPKRRSSWDHPPFSGTVPIFVAGTVPIFVAGTVPIFVAGTVPIFVAGTVPIFVAGRHKNGTVPFGLPASPVPKRGVAIAAFFLVCNRIAGRTFYR